MDSRRTNPRIVLVGIQARTNSERFPNKVMQVVAGKTILKHVLDACSDAASYLNRNFNRYQCNTKVAILVPDGDPIKQRHRDALSFPGVREEDVLTRYYLGMKEMRADYVVRITADCVSLPSHLVSSHIKTALYGDHDYVTNTHHRTFREGWDVEVISANLMDWLTVYAATPEHREHVTMLLRDRSLVPRSFKYCHVYDNVDDSHIKTSIDEPIDLLNFQAERDSIDSKKAAAIANGDMVR